MDSIIVLAVIAAILGFAIWYVRKEKKTGARCIGCADSKTCSGHCNCCGGCNH